MQPKRLRIIPMLTAGLMVWFFVSWASADTVMLEPTKDNTLYESTEGNLSNGEGLFFFAGRNGPGGGSVILRSLLAFDVDAF